MTPIYLLSIRDLKTLTSIINSELLKISNWYKINKLSLIINKTNYIYFNFSTRCHKHNLDLKLIIDMNKLIELIILNFEASL